MANEGMLLRLLEPIVRPDGLPSRSTPTPAQPFEARSFESFMQEARSISVDEANGDAIDQTTQSPAKDASLNALSGVDRIENAALRNIVQTQSDRQSPNA